MGKIIGTTYHDKVQDITNFNSTLINNTFYSLSDKKPTIVTYYNIDLEKSSLDPGSKIPYNNIGEDSPIRFNKIENFLIYGFDRIELNTDYDEFGIEADKITGDCYILPNTIVPVENDYFEVEHIKDSSWLFIVTDVQRDTLENGSNVYKITYKLEYADHDKIQSQVVDDYKAVEVRDGTTRIQVVQSTKLEKAKELDRLAVLLKHYFIEFFYNPYVQTFIYMDINEWRMYDPYMIEFMIRNKILENDTYDDDFLYVMHIIDPGATFGYSYDKTFFKVFEDKDKDRLMASNYTVLPEEIKSYGTTFAARCEIYFKTVYDRKTYAYNIQCIPDELIFRITENRLVQDGDKDPLWFNILIKHFNGEEITKKEIEFLEHDLDINSNAVEFFYCLPLMILSLETKVDEYLNKIESHANQHVNKI